LAAWTVSGRAGRRRVRRAIGATVVVILCEVSGPAAAGEASSAATLRFSLHAEPVATTDIASLRRTIASRRVRVFEPYESREVVFDALPFDAVLDAVYARAWRDQEELLFTCRDGYQPTVPVRRVLDHKAWLAFDRVDEDGFSILKLESGSRRRVDLSPVYLIWENLDDPRMREEGDYGWPYQLVGVDVIRPRDRFPHTAPPRGASRAAVEGYAAFRVHCSRCHTINGGGGAIGPELNYPVNPVEYWKGEWLRRWIDDPREIRPATRMPPFNPVLPERMRVIDNIIAYLEAMSTAKVDPANVP
jgi:mono/diheme cytochrome c family protein